MKSRAEIKEFILKLERDFPVDEWKIDDVHVWPYLRIKLFSKMLVHNEPNYVAKNGQISSMEVKMKSGIIRAKIDRVKNSAKYLLQKSSFKLRRIPKRNILVATSAPHRSKYQGKSINRFADPILNELGNGINIETSPIEEYDQKIISQPRRVIFFYDYLNAVIKSDKRKLRLTKKKEVELEQYERFEEEVRRSLGDNFDGSGVSKEALLNVMDRFHDFAETYELILSRVNPYTVFSVCYYTFSVMVLNYVANKKGICTIEIQHGPQAEYHMSYDSWLKVPNKGYNTMPKYFWNWDRYSYNLMGQWINRQNYHLNFIAGNPWVQYFIQDNVSHDIILYSLQNYTVESSFPDFLIDEVRDSNSEWWIRIHPRQMKDQEALISFFQEKGVLDRINIQEASNTPLPMVLSRTKIHVTRSSGCTLEAASFGIPTLIIDPVGKEYYKDLIKEGMAVFCDDALHFHEELNNLDLRSMERKSQEKYDWKKIIEELK